MNNFEQKTMQITKVLCLGLFLLTAEGHLNAQKAPDFTVTDFNNKTHKLYDDYLNKNKVVVIKFFFIGCPPCASVAPYVQQAYTRNGSGAGNVEFFQITTLASDKNASVKSYHQSKGFTFPGIGSDGGSQAALNPYKSGTFGTWYGTPTFVVIAPNGDVDYNVPLSGGNPYALDTAINRAFRKVNGGGGGGQTCEDSFHVKTITKIQPDGYLLVDYLNANNSNTLDSGIYKCQFSLPSNLDETYVTAYINKQDDPVNGITTADIVKIQRHILKLDTLNNLQSMLADVNNSSSVTAADVAEIRKLILGVTARFSKLPQQFGVMHNPKSKNPWDFNNKVLVKDLIDKSKVNEFGVGKFGDITGSNVLWNSNINTRKQSSVILNSRSIHQPNGLYEHQYFLSQPAKLEGFQLSLKQNHGHLADCYTKQASLDLMYLIDPAQSSIRISAIMTDNAHHDLDMSQPLLSVLSHSGDPLMLEEKDGFVHEWVCQDFIANIGLANNNSTHPVAMHLRQTKDRLIVQSSKAMVAYQMINSMGQCLTQRSFRDQPLNLLELQTSYCPTGFFIIGLTFCDGTTQCIKVCGD